MTDRLTVAPRWLDDEEMGAWTAFISVLFRLPSALDRQLRADAGLTHLQYAVLSMLSDHRETGVAMTALADNIAVELSRLSHSVRVLEERGIVSRQPSPDDRRCQIVRLTDAGDAVLRAAAPSHVDLVRRLVVDRLTAADLADVERVSRTILAAIDTAELGARPGGEDQKAIVLR